MKLTSYIYSYLCSGERYRGVDLYLLVSNYIEPAAASRQYLRMLIKDSPHGKNKSLATVVKLGRRRVFSQCVGNLSSDGRISITRDTPRATVFNSDIWMSEEQITSLFKNPQRRGQTIACIDKLLCMGRISITARHAAKEAATAACVQEKESETTTNDSQGEIV